MKLLYVKAELITVEFENAANSRTKSNIVTAEAVDITNDISAQLPFRGWRRRVGLPPDSYAVSHRFSANAALNITVRITPAGLDFEIEGSGIQGQFGPLLWKKGGWTSLGAPQLLPNIVPLGNLPQSAGISKGSISWKINTKCCQNPVVLFSTATIPEKSGEHEIFRTFLATNSWEGALSSPSLVRMRKIGGMAEGLTTEGTVIDKLVDEWPFVPGPVGQEGSDWRIFLDKEADCDDHCDCLHDALKLFGLKIERLKIFASTADNSCLIGETKEIEVMINGKLEKVEAILIFGTLAGGVPGEKASDRGGNRHQGVLRKDGVYINIYGGKFKKPNSCAMFNALTGPGNMFKAQYWVYAKEPGSQVLFIHSTESIPNLTCNQ